MLVIRREQMLALERELVRERFVGTITGILRDRSPAWCAGRDADEIRRFILVGVEKAQRFGAERSSDYAAFIDLMILLGEDFDADPAHAWTAPFRDSARHGDFDAFVTAALEHLPDGAPDP